MNKIDAGTLTRTVLLWLAIANQILAALGMNPLLLSNETVAAIITSVFALWAWWKNNSFTSAAIQADEYKKKLK